MFTLTKYAKIATIIMYYYAEILHKKCKFFVFKKDKKEITMEEKTPKISVIVPIFNSLNWLDKCIFSIVNQTYKNLEIILIDDGSNDGSSNLCDTYAKKDERIIVIHKSNEGLSLARNAGLKIATGEFVLFADSDDYLEDNMLEKLILSQKQDNADMVICGFIMEDELGNKYADTPELENKTYSNKEALKLLNLNRQDRFVVAWNKLYKRNLFEDIQYPKGKIHEDQWVAHKLFFKSNKITTIQPSLYHYVIHKDSIMNASNPLKHFDDIDALFDRIEFYKNNKLYDLIDGVFNVMYNLFSFYREKIFAYKNFTFAELNKIYSYGNKCKKLLKRNIKHINFSKNTVRKSLKIYSFSFIEKLKLFYKNILKVKNGK